LRCRWQAIEREHSTLQNASFMSCNLKLSRPEVLTFFDLLCKWCWRWQYALQAANDLSANWNWSLSLRASVTSSKSEQVVWSSFDENRKGRNSESFLWWNHRRLCFDKGTESVVLNAILCDLTGKGGRYSSFDGSGFFEHMW